MLFSFSVIFSVGPFFLFILLVELSHSSRLTVKQGPCSVSSSFRSRHFTLLFPFESLTTHSHYHFAWNTFFDKYWNIFSVELSHSFGVTVTQVSCNVFPLPRSGHPTLILSFESLLTHSHNYVVWNATQFFRWCFKLFHSSSITAIQDPYNISWLFLSGHSTLLFPRESMMTRSHNLIV